MMKLSPEMIDAAVLQLQSIFENAEGVPDKVRTTGKEFVSALDEWSESLKAAAVKNGD